LLIETFVSQTKRRDKPLVVPLPAEKKRPRRKRKSPVAAAATGLFFAFGASGLGCEAADRLFTRNAPEVDDAIELLDAGDAAAAVDLLERYLSTGSCEKASIGTPERLRQRP